MIKKFIMFCFAGVLSAGIDLIVFNALFQLEIFFPISRTLAVLSAIIFNFYLNKNMTFKSKNIPAKKQFPKHLIVYSFALITNVLISYLIFCMLSKNTFNANIASILGIISAIPISFFGSIFWTFKK